MLAADSRVFRNAIVVCEASTEGTRWVPPHRHQGPPRAYLFGYEYAERRVVDATAAVVRALPADSRQTWRPALPWPAVRHCSLAASTPALKHAEDQMKPLSFAYVAYVPALLAARHPVITTYPARLPPLDMMPLKPE